jgi:hypothetical protein
VVVGTSNEDLYLIRRYGRTLNADLLQRDRSLLTNLWSSGARFMGIAPTQSTNVDVLKLIPVPLSFLLLSLSQKHLTAWADWANPGEEKVVWEQEIHHMLSEDVFALGSVADRRAAEALELVDAGLMHVEAGAEQATLLILSAEPASAAGNKAVLWLHTLEIQLREEGSQPAVRILHRTRLTKQAHFRFHSDSVGDEERITVPPTLAVQPPSWRVFVAWSEEPVDGLTTAAAGPTLHGAQIDVLNQPLLNAAAATASRGAVDGARGQTALREESISCRHAEDSKLPANDVLAVSAVKGVDGLCVVKNGKLRNPA